MLHSRCPALLRAASSFAASTMAPGGNPLLHVLGGNRFASTKGAVYDVDLATNIRWQEGAVPTEEKEKLLNQRGCVVWFTGLSGSGKSTVAATLEHALVQRNKLTALLDGDNVRHGLNSNLGFTAADREENIRRIGEVSKLFADAGIITLVSFISPYERDRNRVRARLAVGQFIEVHMKVPIDICEQRDVKGLYKKARAGLLKGFTGIDDPYEAPQAAELTLEAVDASGRRYGAEEQAAALLNYLQQNNYLGAPGNEAKAQ